ncbi:uncharacterized protein LOC116306893 [Actinia tenebrosa]|uniref:Uncharacterized protein LOC116306893 n=1 Tax=Actinia tenebrosa TaxID=6105 RepID=A0A6P8J0B6_ACTTE|nr:uncharacterized protein LOC116306893 [Actinia tenebrosa]
MSSLKLFIFIFEICLWLPCTSTLSPRIFAASDYFIVNDQEVRQQTADDRGVLRNRRTTLDKLQLVDNDVVLDPPRAEKTCVLTSILTASQPKDRMPSHNHFQDVHKEAGFHHIHRDYMAVRPHCVFDFIIPHHNSSKETRLRGEFCIPEHLTGGAAVGDYDNDGLQDIYFTLFHKTSVLYRNNGDGTFTDVTKDVGLGPSRCASGAGWIDVDEDGDLDLYVTTVGDSRHYLYINYGGFFVEEAEKRNCSLVFPNKRKLAGMTPNFGDFDRDGFLDIYVTEWILHTVGKPSASRLLRNKGFVKAGYFEDITDQVGLNMDGYRGGSSLNRGTHTFGASFTDFDEDGWPELLVTADYGDSKMFWNKNGKSFVECTEKCGLRGEQDAMGHAIGDWDNDSHLDWFSTAIFHNQTDCSITGCVFGSGGNRLYRNHGNRRFDDATDKAGVRNGGWGWGAAFIDFNNDGYLDVVMTNGVDFPSTTTDDHFQKQSMILWQNLGPGYNGSTKEVSNAVGLNATGQGRGLLKFDFDDDGDEDVVVCNNLGPPQLYDNKGGNKRNWLKVRVVHNCLTFSDKLCDSYGARVQVLTSSNHIQTKEVGSDTHFLGQSEITTHFGLGSESGNVDVKVTWPGGLFEVTVTDVQPNRRIRVMKPSLQLGGKQSTSFKNLTVCSTLRIIAIEKQPSHATVVINPDGRSVSFKIDEGVNMRSLNMETFVYRVALVQGDNTTLLNTTTTAFVVFHYNDSDGGSNSGECVNGRHAGSKPTPTNKRRFDGISNNQKNVFWGANMEDLTRDIPAAYEDKLASLSGTCTIQQRKLGTCTFPDELNGIGSNRPSPRNISNVLFYQVKSKISSRRLSDMHAHFGQFLAHDTDFSSPLPRFEFDGQLNDVWLPISVPKGDVHFDQRDKGTEYLSFVRSTFNRCTGRNHGTPRQQINKITSYIDGSVVYGDSEGRNAHLRTKQNGKMKLTRNGIIPSNSMGIANDNVVGRDASRLLVAGDTRANVQPGLIALHSLFVREHNRLCDEYLKTHHKVL